MLRINTIEPTVFFIKQKNELLQAVDISIENTEETLEASVDAKFGSKERHTDIGKLITYNNFVKTCQVVFFKIILPILSYNMDNGTSSSSIHFLTVFHFRNNYSK